jgi:ATP-binding cassette subfamily B protein
VPFPFLFLRYYMKTLLNYLKSTPRDSSAGTATGRLKHWLLPDGSVYYRTPVDNYINKHDKLTHHDYVWGVMGLVGLAIGAAMVSRIAKNFQDYFSNVIVQKTGAQMYADGLKHSLELPYQVFEDQRSGETLSILQKVRTDSEKFITSFISILFVSLVGMLMVIVYSLSVSYKVTLVYFGAIPVIAFVSTALSSRIKTIQRTIVAETNALAGSTTESLRNIELVKSLGLVKQEIERLNKTTYKILDLELKKVKFVRSMSFVQGTTVNLVRSMYDCCFAAADI